MPLGKYNKVFGGKKGAARSAYLGMVRTYGPQRGSNVFYAVVRKYEKEHGKIR